MKYSSHMIKRISPLNTMKWIKGNIKKIEEFKSVVVWMKWYWRVCDSRTQKHPLKLSGNSYIYNIDKIHLVRFIFASSFTLFFFLKMNVNVQTVNIHFNSVLRGFSSSHFKHFFPFFYRCDLTNVIIKTKSLCCRYRRDGKSKSQSLIIL